MRLTELAAGGMAVAVVSAGELQQTSGADSSSTVQQASSTVVLPRPIPEISEGHAGIAARYPGDVGIERDPDVVFAESFEGSVDEICSHWEAVAGKPIMSKSGDVPPGSGGKQSLLLTRVSGGTQGYMDGGRPFPGFSWRNTAELNINALWLYRYMSQPEKGMSKVWWDHLIVAKKYIGPLTPLRASRSVGVLVD